MTRIQDYSAVTIILQGPAGGLNLLASGHPMAGGRALALAAAAGG